MPNVDKDVNNGNFSILLVKWNMVHPLWKTAVSFLMKLNIYIAYCPACLQKD